MTSSDAWTTALVTIRRHARADVSAQRGTNLNFPMFRDGVANFAGKSWGDQAASMTCSHTDRKTFQSIKANQAARRDQHSFCHGLRTPLPPAFRSSRFRTEQPDPKDEL